MTSPPDGQGFVMIKRGDEGTQLIVVLNRLAEFEALSSGAPRSLDPLSIEHDVDAFQHRF